MATWKISFFIALPGLILSLASIPADGPLGIALGVTTFRMLIQKREK